MGEFKICVRRTSFRPIQPYVVSSLVSVPSSSSEVVIGRSSVSAKRNDGPPWPQMGQKGKLVSDR